MENNTESRKMKVALFLAFLFPSLLVSLLLSLLFTSVIGYLFPIFALAIGIALSIFLSFYLDRKIKSRNIKIIIASLSGLISIVSAYLIIRMLSSEIVVCDPVHIPTRCETSCQDILKNATNMTSQVEEKYSQCVTQCQDICREMVKNITNSTVAQEELNKCMYGT